MKLNKIIIFVVIISFFSGLLGSFLMINYLKGSLIGENGNNSSTLNKVQNVNKFVTIGNIENEITNIVKNLSPGVVSIVIKKDLTLYKSDPWGFFNTPVGTVKRKVGGGTGFFVTKDGIIITNKHVIVDQQAEYSVLTNDGKEYSATVLAIDPLTDLAIIKINSNEEFTTLNFVENEDSVKIGEFGIAIGNSLAEFQNSVSLGVISGKNRSIDIGDGTKLSGLLQTDAAINPGNSGGPLVDLNGEVVGINTAIVSNSNSLGFSIPLSKRKIDFILDSIKKYSEIKKPFIGINYQILDDNLKEQLGLSVNYGAYIAKTDGSVLKGSQADKAGLEKGDIILKVDNIDVTTSNDLNSIIQNKIPGDVLDLVVLKSNGEQKNIKLELGTN